MTWPPGQFTQFPVPEPADVAVDEAGIVWFTAPLDSGDRTARPGDRRRRRSRRPPFPGRSPSPLTGTIWFTERFTPQAVGRLVPATGEVTEFPRTNVGPEGIAASPDGSVWFTQTTKGNIAQITDSGVITEGKVVKSSEPFGITVAADGDPWYAMMSANKIATLRLR